MNAIEFHNVSKKFKKGESFNSLRDFIPNLVKGIFSRNGKNETLGEQEFWALKDINFELKKGETLGIIGPNGAGKSTILKLLSQILKPTKGQINIDGKLSALIEVGAGFHTDLTGRENIYLSGAIMGMKKQEIDKKFDSIVEFSELSEFIDTPVKRYSSGMYVRLGFSVAAHMEPEVLLIDEVLSVGDIGFQTKCIERIRDLVAKKVTIIFISHNLDSVLGLCERTITLNEGRIYFEGNTEKAIVKYREIINRRYEKNNPIDEKDKTESIAKPVEIKNVLFLDKDRKVKSEFFTGDQIIIRMEFIANKKIKKPVFGIAFHRSDGLYLYGSNTGFDNYEIEEIEGKGTIEFESHSLNLLTGNYFVSGGIFSEGALSTYDFQDKKYNFSIKHTKNDHGVIFINHSWKFDNAINSKDRTI